MAFNINDMRSQLALGGARPTLFQVNITNPVNSAGDIKVPFMVHATDLPESTLGTIEVPYFGRKVKIAGDRTFAPWTVTVFNDEDFLIRNAMEEWMNAINSHVGNLNLLGTSSPSQYKSQAQVSQLSKTGEVVRVYNFSGIFPVSLQAIPLDWNSTNAIEQFQIQFDYDWWEVSGGTTGNANTNQ